MLEAHYQRREGRVQTGWTEAVLGGSRRLRLVNLARGPVPEDTADGDLLLDLSTRGMKIRTAAPAPELGDGLLIELRHPELKGSITLRGEVRWTEPEGHGQCRVGVAFVEMRDTTTIALEQLITLELGHSVTGPTGQVGFLAPGRDGTWTCYALDRTRLGIVRPGAQGFELVVGSDAHPCPDLPAALARAFDTSEVRVHPPLP